MLEIYLSTFIIYCILAVAIGALIGYNTLTQEGKTLDIFGAFKKFKLTALFEWIFGIIAKTLKALTGIDIDPEIKK